MVEEEPKLQVALETADDNDVQVDFSKKKKKKKAKKDKTGAGPTKKSGVAQAEEAKGFNWEVAGHKQYEFSYLLDRIESTMNDKNNEDEEEEKATRGEMPQTKFVSTKTSIMNFDILCEQLEREPTHLLDYIKAEMDVEGNFGSERNVLLQGRHKAPTINSLYKKYIEQYVRCLGCKSIKTTMTRDPSTRLLNLQCK